jgi:hypothetical protein
MAGVTSRILNILLLIISMLFVVFNRAHAASLPVQDLQLTIQYFPSKASGRNASMAQSRWLKVCDQFSKRFRVQNGIWGSGAFSEVKCWDGRGAKPSSTSWNLIVSEESGEVRFRLFSADSAQIEGGAQMTPTATLILPAANWKLESLSDGILAGRIVAALTDQLPVFARIDIKNIDIKNGTVSLPPSGMHEKAELVTTLPPKIILYGIWKDSTSKVYRAHVYGEATFISQPSKHNSSRPLWKLEGKWESISPQWVWIHNRDGLGRISPAWKTLSLQRLKELELKAQIDQDKIDAVAAASLKSEPLATSPIVGAYYGTAVETGSISPKKGYYVGLFKESGIVPTKGFLFYLNQWKLLTPAPQFSVDFNLSNLQLAWAWSMNWSLGMLSITPMPVLRFSVLRSALYETENGAAQSLGGASTNIVSGGGGLIVEAPFTKFRLRSFLAYEYGLYTSGSENSFWGAQGRLEGTYSPQFCSKVGGKFSCAFSTAFFVEYGALKNEKKPEVDKKYSLAVLNIKYAVSFLAFGIGVWW